MKVCLLFLFLLILKLDCYSQGRDNLWMMGYQCCQANFGGTDIDFVSGSPVIATTFRRMNFNMTNAVITNLSGNILFYTNGAYIVNRSTLLQLREI